MMDSVEPRDYVSDFRGLLKSPEFSRSIHVLLDSLKGVLGHEVDLEFACDGERFYLLQCRPHNVPPSRQPADLPASPDFESILFNAVKFVPNGRISDVRYLIYIDPEGFRALAGDADRRNVSQAVTAVNKLLPEKSYALLAPVRIGSKGDPMGGPDIEFYGYSNAALLVEISSPRLGYTSSPSFGGHASNDLIENNIFCLAAYPDDPGIEFNWDLLKGAPNLLPEYAPAYKHLSQVVRVIDLERLEAGLRLEVYMNSGKEQALALLETKPAQSNS